MTYGQNDQNVAYQLLQFSILFYIQISKKLVFIDLISNKAALVQIMVWCPTYGKPQFKPAVA